MPETVKTYLLVPTRIHRMAKMAAARLGVGVSEYFSGLVLEDSVRTGIASFVEGGTEREGQPRHDEAEGQEQGE